jgi:tripartite-type tricarboxylate transporter receptor subunit TctC
VVARLNRDINRVLNTAAVKDKIASLGGEILPITPQEFGAKAAEDSKRFGALIKERQIKGD